MYHMTICDVHRQKFQKALVGWLCQQDHSPQLYMYGQCSFFAKIQTFEKFSLHRIFSWFVRLLPLACLSLLYECRQWNYLTKRLWVMIRVHSLSSSYMSNEYIWSVIWLGEKFSPIIFRSRWDSILKISSSPITLSYKHPHCCSSAFWDMTIKIWSFLSRRHFLWSTFHFHVWFDYDWKCFQYAVGYLLVDYSLDHDEKLFC